MTIKQIYQLILVSVITMTTACSNVDTADDTSDSESTPSLSESNTSEIPLFSEALNCTDLPTSYVGSGGDFRKVTLNSEDAICNDGSPAVMYIKTAATLEGTGNWNIHFQGGSSCSGMDCAQRWCEKSGRMSSLSTPNSTNFGGFLGQDPNNLKPDANEVFLYYCSSDNYTGQKSDAVISETDETPEFRIHFKGHEIVERAMEMLEFGAVSDDESVALPPLGGNGLVTISGTSAGCVGVIHNSDRIAQRVKPLGHDTQVVCDGSFGPDIPFLPEDERTESLILFAEQVSAERDLNWQPRRDDSCMDLQTEEPWRCDFASYVMSNHIAESPAFVRMDLGDPTISAGYTELGFSMQEFAEYTRAGLVSMADSSGAETKIRPVSVFSPVCGIHVGLLANEHYFDTSIDTEGSAVNLNQAIESWSGGQDFVAIDTIPSTLTTCAE